MRKVSHYGTLPNHPFSLASFPSLHFLMNFVHSKGEGYSQGCLWPEFIRYAFDPVNEAITQWSLDWFEGRIGPYIPSPSDLSIPPMTGLLCQVCSGDGKRRSIGNYVNQRLLYPVHQWLADLLRTIPQDGTFDQTKPLDLLRGVSDIVHSVDLKSATDRWPLVLMFELMQSLFGRSFASSAVNSTLGTNVFLIPFVNRKANICFVAGQPLGYYSSWPLFALSHHFVMWYAAEQVYPGKKFRGYAILGDDLIITDDRVKEVYSAVRGRLGVRISSSKSLSWSR